MSDNDVQYSIVLSNNHLAANGIQWYLLGLKCETDNEIVMNGLRYVDGKFQLNEECMKHMGDNSILCVIKHGTAWHVTYRANGRLDYGKSVSTDELAQVTAFVQTHFADYLARELRYVKEQPWINLVGLAPAEAVAWLCENGWPLIDRVAKREVYPIELTPTGVQFKEKEK